MKYQNAKYRNKEWLEEQIKKGLSGRQIALQNGYSIFVVRRWMIKFNLWNYGVHPNSVDIFKKINSNAKRKKINKRRSWSRQKVEAIIARRKNKGL